MYSMCPVWLLLLNRCAFVRLGLLLDRNTHRKLLRRLVRVCELPTYRHTATWRKQCRERMVQQTPPVKHVPFRGDRKPHLCSLPWDDYLQWQNAPWDTKTRQGCPCKMHFVVSAMAFARETILICSQSITSHTRQSRRINDVAFFLQSLTGTSDLTACNSLVACASWVYNSSWN